MKKFIKCERCGKKLIERLPSGVWKFVFGRNPEDITRPPVKMLIKGSIKMYCLKRSCHHENILPYFPNSDDFKEEAPQSGPPE
jgi:hypothetical protein